MVLFCLDFRTWSVINTLMAYVVNTGVSLMLYRRMRLTKPAAAGLLTAYVSTKCYLVQLTPVQFVFRVVGTTSLVLVCSVGFYT